MAAAATCRMLRPLAAKPSASALGAAVRSMSAAPVLEELPGIPTLKPAAKLAPPQTRVTTLSNGVRVASEENYGQVFSVGLFANAGSMYETEATRGAAHFAEIMAFKSTGSKSAEQIAQEVQEEGHHISAHATREHMVYRVDGLRSGVDDAVELLASTVVDPALTDAEMEEAKRVVEFNHMDLGANPQLQIEEALHLSAFGQDSPLGRSPLCPLTRVPEMDASVLRAHMNSLYTGDRLVLAGAGVDHDRLVTIAQRFLSDIPGPPATPIEEPSQEYIGGDCRFNAESQYQNPMLAPPGQELTHITLAFPSTGARGKSMVVEHALDTLLGGGSAFSAGGPGKGMYSRLYREVLNRYEWVEAAHGYSLQMPNVSLVGIYGAAPSGHAADMVNVIVGHFLRLASEKVAPGDLERAKNQLRSSVMMNLELRGVLCEDIGRQVLLLKDRTPPAEVCELIANVTADDIQDLAIRMMSQAPSLAAFGPHTGVQDYVSVKNYIDNHMAQLRQARGE